MYSVSFLDVAYAMAQIFMMAFAGFAAARVKWMDPDGLKLISKLLINFFWPCYVFFHLTEHFSFVAYPHWWIYPLLSFGVTLSGLLVGGGVLALFPNIKQKRELVSLVTFQNSGYLPLMLATTIFQGEEARQLTIMILLFIIGFDFGIWTLGVGILNRSQKIFDAKTLINPPLLAILGTMIFIAMGGQKLLGPVILNPVAKFSDCALPLALLTVGGNLGLMNVSRRHLGPVSAAVLAKVLMVPLLALGITLGFKVDFWMGFLIVLESVVPCAVSLSILARYYEGIDDDFINQGLLLSHVLCLLTIPIFLTCYFKWSG